MFTKRGFLLTLATLAFAAPVHAAHPAMPVIPATVFKVTDYGAVGDGNRDNTTNIQNTINAANAAGGGTVEFPAGTFLSGPITLLSGIRLQVDDGALLQMLPYGTYPGGDARAKTFIGCNDVHDLEITGGGKIDGQGAAWWSAFATNRSLNRPMMLNLFSCNRLFIHDITFQNPPFHHCGLRGNGGNITISNLTVSTRSPSPNTDGLNFVGTNSIIEDCHISVGDDNIAMGSTGPINDLLITNCAFGLGHGVSIGSGISAGISNLTVANCTFTGTQSGIRIKCSGRSAPVRYLNYLNLTMTNVNLPIVIYTYYNVTGTPHRVTPAQVLSAAARASTGPETPVWGDITFSNVTVRSPKGDIGGIIWGPAEMPVSNVTLIHVTNNAPKTFDLYNVRGVKIIDSEFNFPPPSDTFTLCNADVTISNSVPPRHGVSIGSEGTNSLALQNTAAATGMGSPFAANRITLDRGSLIRAGDLIFPPASVLNFSLGATPTTMIATGQLVFDGTINISAADGFGAGDYVLLHYYGKLSGKPVLGTTPAGWSCNLSTNRPGYVVLVVTK